MRKTNWRRVTAGFLAAGALLGAQAPAIAAQDDTCKVMLDNQPLIFTDANRPITRNDRNYVPFRAIAEAMGAQVGWDQETKTATATRGGITVTLPLGEKAVHMVQNGKTREIATDAAAFEQDGVTYVPVRFVAQAFGAAVGWQEGARTVLLVDTEKLKNAMPGSYTYMDQYLAFSIPDGPRQVETDVTLNLAFHDGERDVTIPITAAVSGVQDLDGAALTVDVTADTAQLESVVAAKTTAIPKDVSDLLISMKQVRFEVVVDRVNDACYLRGDSLTGLGVQSGAWVRLSLDAFLSRLTGGALNGRMLDGLAARNLKEIAAGDAADTVLRTLGEDNVGLVNAVIQRYYSLYHDGLFLVSADSLMLSHNIVSADGGSTADKLVLSLDANKQMTGASLTAQVMDAGGTIVLDITSQQDSAGGSVLHAVARNARYDADLTVQTVSTTADHVPARVPSGVIVP